PTVAETGTNPPDGNIAIAAIKDGIYHYVETTGDFMTALETFFRGKNRTELIDAYLDAVVTEMSRTVSDIDKQAAIMSFVQNAVEAVEKGESPAPTQTLGSNAQTAFDALMTQIDTDYVANNQQINTAISAQRESLQTELNAIAADYTAQIKPLEEAFTIQKNQIISQNAQEQADYASKLLQATTQNTLSTELIATKTQSIAYRYQQLTQQTQKEYAFLLNQLDLMPDLSQGSTLQTALFAANDNILSPLSPFAGVMEKTLGDYLSTLDIIEKSQASLDAGLLTQLNAIKEQFAGKEEATQASALQTLLTSDKPAWTAARQEAAIELLNTRLITPALNYDAGIADLNDKSLLKPASSAYLNSLIDSLTQAHLVEAAPLLSQLNADKSALEAEYSASADANTEITRALDALRKAFENGKSDLFNQKNAEISAYKTENPKPGGVRTIDSAVTIDFPTSLMTLASYGGSANDPASAGGKCSGSGLAGCYEEDGFVVGIVADSSNSTAHLHKAAGSDLKDKALEHHADSTGIYLRALSGAAFSLDSMNFSAPITVDNPDAGGSWEILGFNQASNPNLDLGDGSNYATRTAYQTVANGFDGLLNLDSTFNNVNAVWIHYKGYSQTPTNGAIFDVKVDNIKISPVIGNSAEQIAWNTAFENFKTGLDGSYAEKIKLLEDDYAAQKAALSPGEGGSADYQTKLDELESAYNLAKGELDKKYLDNFQALLAKTDQHYTDLSGSQKAIIDIYHSIVNGYSDFHQSAMQTLDLSYGYKAKLDTQIDQLGTLLSNQTNSDLQVLEAKYDSDYNKLTAEENTKRIALGPRPDSESVTINFPSNIMTDAAYGYGANMPPLADGSCPVTGGSPCYIEDGFVIGSPSDGNSTNHLHRASSFVGGGLSDRSLEHHADSSGIYIRALDGSAFDLQSIRFKAPITEDNLIYGEGGPAENPDGISDTPDDIALLGSQEKWEIFGFSNAVNPTITNTDGYATAVALASVPNGFDGKIGTDASSNIVLSNAFKNVAAVWIHYKGYPSTPEGIVFDVKLDNIVLAPLTTQAQKDWLTADAALTAEYETQYAELEKTFDDAKAALGLEEPAYLTAVNGYLDQLDALEKQKNSLIGLFRQQLSSELAAAKDANLSALNASKNSEIGNVDKLEQQLQALQTQYTATLQTLIEQNQASLDALAAAHAQQIQPLTEAKDAEQSALVQDRVLEMQQQLQALIAQDGSLSSAQRRLLATTSESSAEALSALDQLLNEYEAVLSQYQEQAAQRLAEEQSAEIAALETARQAQQEASQAAANAAQALIAESLAKQNTIALYNDILNKMVPGGNPTVQRFQVQPQETRSMPQFTARYYWDNTTLALNSGLSDEPDFLSNFGSVNLSQELNDKLTTLSVGYGLTSNQITRGAAHGGAGHDHGDSAVYPNLDAESTFHNFNVGLGQVFGKNTLYQFSGSYTNQAGYLSNPYKHVYVRGEVTAEEYYLMNLNNQDGKAFDWHGITNLEMVSTELFREVRPDRRNMWSFSNRINQHIPELDASVHLDYRFYTDDWNINSHTFELKWYQSLPGGWTVTPGIRYYSQSQADFFAPYFLAPRADGHYSSDFRLSAFGDLSGGVTVSKQFARGITLEAGLEYVTHSGNLKLGGGGVGDYADFEYYIAHANLNIDFGARPFTIGEHAGHHMHHHHGAPVPAGVMFGHMMEQSDGIMIGYRYQYGAQSGSMLSGSDPVGDPLLIANACPDNSTGCLYKPTKMHMQMHMLDLMYAPTDWLNLMVMPQLMSMDMSMSDSLQPEIENGHGGARHTSNDIGDTVVTALVKIHDDGKHHLHAGVGMSAPTGSIDAQISQGQLKSTAGTEIQPGSEVVQDYGMQLGSGTWDFKPSLTYSGQADDWGWGVQLNGTKRFGKNKYGYAYGDMFQATGWGSYQIMEWLSASVRGVYTWQDKIQGQSSANHEQSSPVDFTHNYGGRFVDVGLGLNVTIPDGQFAGNNISVEWLQPVTTDFNGTQLDRDGALAVTWSFSF
ncbi:MAG: DUF3570 domain-containing protein, partial [Methylomonas sp.]|nr:DUF3570 domain-containing protein [Methylomonas sp.]